MATYVSPATSKQVLPMNPSTQRKTLFIEKKFQGRFILLVIAIIAASGLLSGTLLYFLLASELSSELRTAHLQLQNTWESLAPAIIFGNAITIMVSSLIAALAVLYQSHKISGPAYRLQKICEAISQGDLNPITSLRKADQLTALAHSVEHMVNSLRGKRQQQESDIQELLSLVQQAESLNEAETRNALKQMQERLKNIKL